MSYYGLYVPVKSGASTAGGAAGTAGVAVVGGGSTLGAAAVIASGGGGGEGGGGGDANAVENSPYVFRTKVDALKVLKQHKDARLREFSNTDDAVKYAQTGYELVQTRYNDVKTSTAAVEKAAFRAPTKQELIEFRKVIECGDYEHVKSIIWENPRYLVSSGDTPTTLKEGYRYNALHVCAIAKQANIASLILETVADPEFVDLLTGKKNDVKMCRELAANLLDYYLNIPEKGRSETPLHLAAKTGALDVVGVLTLYPECKMTPNNEGLLPKHIICSRAAHAPPELSKKIARLLEERFYVPVIRSLDNAVPAQIGQPFSANNPPHLNCDPLSPEVKIQALAGPMNKEQAHQFCRRWKTPPRLGSNTSSSPIANNPYISPMKSRTPAKHNESPGFGSPTTGNLQRRALFSQTPQRSPLNLHIEPKQQNGSSNNKEEIEEMALDTEMAAEVAADAADKQNGNHADTTFNIMKEEVEEQMEVVETAAVKEEDTSPTPPPSTNGTCHMEKNNNNNNNRQAPSQLNMLKTALCPRTPLMRQKKDMFFTYRDRQNVASPIVCDMVETNHNDSMAEHYDSPGFKERHIKITDTEKGLEVIGRELAKEQQVEWKEYWDFLNVFLDIASMEGLQKLENFFAQRLREAELNAKKAAQAQAAANAVNLNDVCSALEKFGFCKDPTVLGGGSGGDAVDAVTRNGYYASALSAAYDGSSRSNSQSSSNASTTTPYTCVEKSLQVFAKRMTKTILHNIENIVSINDAFLCELKRLKSLICSFKDDARFLDVNFAKVHARFANLIANYLHNSQDVDAATKLKIQKCLQHILLSPGERKEQLQCVCKKIAVFMENPVEQILPENLKTETMCSKAWLAECECDCPWETNLSRKTSRRNRMETRYKNHQQARHDSANEREREKFELAKATGATAVGQFSEWTNPAAAMGHQCDDELEDDVFWSDFGGSDTDDDDDVWLTPPESPSRISQAQPATERDKYNIFVYGNEPTKRDLDVLNAIFHVDINRKNYPNVYNWKMAVLRFSTEDMDYFPSPAVVKKSHSFSFTTNSSSKPQQQHISSVDSPRPQLKPQPEQLQQLPIAKRLFMSPSRSQQPQQILRQAPLTPLNKIRGLFSAYRERRDSSPMSGMSASPSGFHSERSGSEGSNNLSLLNISAAE